MSNIEVIYEDNHLLVLNKPKNVLSQGDVTGNMSLLEHAKLYIKKKYNKPGEVYLGLVHRLDRPASGLIIYARTSKAAARLMAMFQKKEIDKTYLAMVEGHLPENTQKLEHYLSKNSAQNKSYAVSSQNKEAKKAVLTYKVSQKLDNYSILEVELETGRHHQIRCQLAQIGHPIKGDVKYGAKRANRDVSIDLYAWKLSFIHPVTKERLNLKIEYPFDKFLTK